MAAILSVHLLGGMADVDAIASLASRFGLPLIEDAAECLGATYKGRPIGAPCPTYEGPMRFVVTSFNGNKVITTGGGGAIFVDDRDLATRAKHLTTTAKADSIEFFHDEVGFNYRLTNVAAAIGVAQLEVLREYVERKREIAAQYLKLLGNESTVVGHPEPAHCRSTFWLFTIMANKSARDVVKQLRSSGIGARPMWVPVHRLPAFQEAFCFGSVEAANRLYEYGVCLPCSVGIRSEDIVRCSRSLIESLA